MWGGLQHPALTEEGASCREIGGRAPWEGLQHPGMSEEDAPCRELSDSDPSVWRVWGHTCDGLVGTWSGGKGRSQAGLCHTETTLHTSAEDQ